jgi:hypothetical protein
MLKPLMFPFVLAAGLALAGCGGGIPLIGGGSTSSDTPPEQQQGAGATLRNFALYGGPTVPPSQAPKTDERDLGCPTLDILEGAAGYRGRGSGEAASAVSYQASITASARECITQGSQMRIRVGMEGRLLLGPNGKAGTFQVPVRIVIKRRKDVVTQRFAQVTVTVPSTDTQADFSYLEENLIVNITENDPGDEYDVYIGLDPTGAQAARQDRRPGRRRG